MYRDSPGGIVGIVRETALRIIYACARLRRCFRDGQFEQAVGIALEARRLDRVEAAVQRAPDSAATLDYALRVTQALVVSRDFRFKVRAAFPVYSLPGPTLFSRRLADCGRFRARARPSVLSCARHVVCTARRRLFDWLTAICAGPCFACASCSVHAATCGSQQVHARKPAHASGHLALLSCAVHAGHQNDVPCALHPCRCCGC